MTGATIYLKVLVKQMSSLSKASLSLLPLSPGLTYYRLNAVDNRLQNVDQLLTNDIDKFCSTLVDVYSNVAKVCSPSLSLSSRPNF